ncbi:MAG: ScyD/ScyE family protein [Thermomicrobiales bacterium]
MERTPLGGTGQPEAAPLSRRAMVRGGLGLAAVVGLTGSRVMAEDATPGPTGPVTLAAQRLTNPRGFVWDQRGDLYVALAGSGGAGLLGPESGGYATTGNSGIVARIADGNPVTVSADFPSTTVPGERTLGPAAVAFLGDELYVLEDANAMAYRQNGDQPDGVYRVASDGSLALVADTAAWISANPTSFKPADYNAEGELFGMIAIGDALWVVESNNGQILKVDPDGTIARIADLSTNHPLPTGPAAAPHGGVYVGFLTPAPYSDGSSHVVEVTPDGKVTEVWTGLTMVTAVAVAPDGTLYAAEMATGNTAAAPYIAPDTGRVVRRTGANTLEEVATHVNYPVALGFGPDGALYVAAPALGSIDPDGYILRIDVTAKTPIDVREVAATAGGRHFDTAHTDYFGGVEPAKEEPHPTATATAAPAAAEKTPRATETATEETVSLDAGDFYFKPNAVTIPANTAVTFVIKNVAQIPHNFSIDALKVDVALPPGETTRTTITAPAGSYEFYCNLPGHKAAGMFGTLTVK